MALQDRGVLFPMMLWQSLVVRASQRSSKVAKSVLASSTYRGTKYPSGISRTIASADQRHVLYPPLACRFPSIILLYYTKSAWDAFLFSGGPSAASSTSSSTSIHLRGPLSAVGSQRLSSVVYFPHSSYLVLTLKLAL